MALLASFAYLLMMAALNPEARRGTQGWGSGAGRWPLAAGRWSRWPLAAGRWPLVAGVFRVSCFVSRVTSCSEVFVFVFRVRVWCWCLRFCGLQVRRGLFQFLNCLTLLGVCGPPNPNQEEHNRGSVARCSVVGLLRAPPAPRLGFCRGSASCAFPALPLPDSVWPFGCHQAAY
jgi:hypothetical protein